MKFAIFEKKKKQRIEEEDDEKIVPFRNKCPICKSKNFKPLFDDYAECIDCGHIYHQNVSEIAKEGEKYHYCPKCGGDEFKTLSDGRYECSACLHVYSIKKEEKKRVKEERKEILETPRQGEEKIIFKEEKFDFSGKGDEKIIPKDEKSDLESEKTEVSKKSIIDVECPKCGSTEIQEYQNRKYKCSDCGYKFLREWIRH